MRVKELLNVMIKEGKENSCFPMSRGNVSIYCNGMD